MNFIALASLISPWKVQGLNLVENLTRNSNRGEFVFNCFQQVQNKQHANNLLRLQSWGKKGEILKAHANSLTHLNAKLCPNQHGRGAIRAQNCGHVHN
jgi:hypothetical protein